MRYPKFRTVPEAINYFENEIDRIGDANARAKSNLTIQLEETQKALREAEDRLASMTTTWGIRETWGAVKPCVSEDVARELVAKATINVPTLVCYQHNDWHEPKEES